MREHEDGRLPAALWIDAHLKRLTIEGVPYYVLNKGAYAAGTVMLKINTLDKGCLVLQQQRGLDGVLGWMGLFKSEMVAEKEADDYIRRAVARDPDLWVIEIEDRQGRNPFEGKTI